MTLWRTDIVSWRMKFQCATNGAPKRGKKRTITIEHSPQNLAEMLDYVRAMGYRPEDIAVYDINFETEYSNVYV